MKDENKDIKKNIDERNWIEKFIDEVISFYLDCCGVRTNHRKK